LEQRLDDLAFRTETAMSERLYAQRRTLGDLAAAVLRHDPRQQLSGARETLAALQSRLDYALDRRLSVERYRRESAETRLFRAAQNSISARRSAWTNLRSELQALSPLAVLQRGYALVQDADGVLVRSVEQLAAGQIVQTRLGDGSFSSSVTETRLNTKKKDKPTPK
jgi:exodeoxyribonuclease VII large subunit